MLRLAALLVVLTTLPAFGHPSPVPLFTRQALARLGAAELWGRRLEVSKLLAAATKPSERADALQAELELIDALLRTPRASRSPAPDAQAGGPSFSLGASDCDHMFDGRKKRRPGFGLLPSENTGALGPAMRSEGASVLGAKKTAISFEMDGANYLTDQGSKRWVYQKFERQTLSLELRRGIKTDLLPAVEFGVRLDARRRRLGVLNDFISGWEHGLAWVTQNEDFVNWDRTGEDAYTGTDEFIIMDGRELRVDGARSNLRFSDALFTVKAALLRSRPRTFVPDVAVRLVANVPNLKNPDNNGDFAGAGLSISQPVGRRTTLHADARVLKPRKAQDALGLDLKNFAFGGTFGVERRIDTRRLKNTSFGLQFNHNQSPHKFIGATAIDATRTDVTLGFSHLARIAGQNVLFQLYGREDINLSGGGGGYLTPYSPPDFQGGLRVTWTPE